MPVIIEVLECRSIMKNRDNFIKNPEILSNTCQEDCFDYANHAAEMYQKFKSMPKNSLMALVGNDGVGKTFLVRMMESVNAKNTSDNAHWFYFDVNEHLEEDNLWNSFRSRLSQAIKLSKLRKFRFDLRFIWEGIHDRLFKKGNTFTRIVVAAILIFAFVVFVIIAVYVSIILAIVITTAVLVGILPIFAVRSFLKDLDKKLTPKADHIRDLLIQIMASDKNIFVVIDNVHAINQREIVLLQKIRRVLDRNRLGKEVRIMLSISPHTMMLCNQNHCLEHVDCIELFRPALATDEFIKKAFTRQFIKWATLSKCGQLVASILENANQNLHVLKLIMRTAEYQNKHTVDPNVSGMASFERLTTLSGEYLDCLVDSTEMNETKKLASPEG